MWLRAAPPGRDAIRGFIQLAAAALRRAAFGGTGADRLLRYARGSFDRSGVPEGSPLASRFEALADAARRVGPEESGPAAGEPGSGD